MNDQELTIDNMLCWLGQSGLTVTVNAIGIPGGAQAMVRVGDLYYMVTLGAGGELAAACGECTSIGEALRRGARAAGLDVPAELATV